MLGSRGLTQFHDDSNASLAVKSHAGMAHFAGTGPQFETCQRCFFWIRHSLKKNSTKNVCKEFHRLTGDWGDYVPAGASACKYFQLRKNATPGRQEGLL